MTVDKIHCLLPDHDVLTERDGFHSSSSNKTR
jgi:hypothetical protein